MKYKEGQSVHVKLEGLIIPGKIKGIDSKGNYTVLFDGGSQKVVTEKMIKPANSRMLNNDNSPPKIEPLSPSRRVALRQSPTRAIARKSPSPVRRRSPGRSPGRPRVAKSRKSPSPARKSLGRIRRSSPSPTPVNILPQVTSPTRILKVSLENIDLGDHNPRQRKLVDQVNTIHTLESVPLPHDVLEPEPFEELYEKNDQAQQTAKLINDVGKFSDDDDVAEVIFPNRDKKSEPRSVKPPREFGGWFGAFVLTLLIPSSVLLLNLVCNRDISCSFSQLVNIDYKNVLITESYFNWQVTAMYIAYILLLALLSKLSFVGKQIKSLPSRDQSFVYKMNGLFSAFFVLTLIIIAESQNYPVVNYLINNYFYFLVSSLIVGLCISVVLFVQSKFQSVSLLNPYASTYNFIYDFFLGRQVNPRVLNIDIKLVLLRASYIISLIINSAFIFKSLNIYQQNDNILSAVNIEIDPALIICGGLQIFYILDLLLFEKNLITTFELQYEGLGYMRVMLYAAYPFFTTATTKYLYEHSNASERNIWVLSTIVCVFLIGYFIYRGSNSQKNAFRMNPYDGALSYLQTMPTGQGKKLLTSGWWGRVRHPNYTGDIIMHLAIGALCAGSVAGLGVLPPALFLALRASRDSKRCRRRYGLAWDRYMHKVRYNIVPFIY